MAISRLGADNTGDPGILFRIIVHLCGLAAIAGIFLPFIANQTIIGLVQQFGVAGLGSMAGKTTMGTITNVVLYSSFLLFPLIGVVMAIRGKYAGGPFTFLVIYNILAFFLVLLFGADTANIVGNFFVNTGLGYWISCGGLFLPFLAMFFLDKSI